MCETARSQRPTLREIEEVGLGCTYAATVVAARRGTKALASYVVTASTTARPARASRKGLSCRSLPPPAPARPPWSPSTARSRASLAHPSVAARIAGAFGRRTAAENFGAAPRRRRSSAAILRVKTPTGVAAIRMWTLVLQEASPAMSAPSPPFLATTYRRRPQTGVGRGVRQQVLSSTSRRAASYIPSCRLVRCGCP